MPRMRYRIGDSITTIDLTPAPDGGWIVEIDGVRYDVGVQMLASGGMRLRIDDEALLAYVQPEGDRRHVWVDGEAATLDVVQGRARVRDAGAQSGLLTAQMPGVVRAVMVAAGSPVTRGQTLAILEAMKMELRVLAPDDGHVRAVHVAEGQGVERGTLLIEMEHRA